MASDQMEVAALGRPFALGMLYDAYRDKLITDFSLWDRETIQKYKIKKTQNGTFCETTVSDSIDEKASLLKADASLIVSFLSGLVEVGGAANYLLDDKEFKNQSRVIHQYRATTAYERLELNHQDAKKLQIEEVIRNSNATHVVTGILYGANAFFVFDSEKLDSSTVHSMETSMRSSIKKIPKLCPQLKLDRHLREADKKIIGNFTCKFFGDFILEKNPTTFEEAVDTYRKLPELLGNNGEKSVPVKAWLTPLKNLDPAAAELKGNLSDGLIRKVDNVLKSIREIQLRCNETLEKGLVKTFPQMHKKLKCFQHLTEDYKKKVQQIMQEKIPLIREGEEEEESLQSFLDEQDKSPFSQMNLDKWLDYLDREINVIASCLDIMKGIKMIPEKSDLDRNVLGVEDALCFVFTSIETHDSYMDQMVNYFKETPSSVTPPSKDQWFFSDKVLENMKQKANMISETAKNLKSNSRYCFLVAALPNKEFNGATIYHYREGVKQTEDFSKPVIHRVKNVMEKKDLMWYYCDLTLDPETVNGNLVLQHGLKGCHYFEVMWSNETTKGIGVGLAYEGVPRNGNGLHTGFGYNDISWYFGVYSNSYCVWHNSKKIWSSTRPSGCNRIGVYLDWPGGTLSFYQVSSNSLTHLHTFEKRFSVPLYPGFYIWDKST
ncbi:stonustoxin subunit beta-like [Cyprinodon tularosa]|uniref:stonustoxin subunit beta-like n=1 Tax=Cyprinodon tularosa TaxID=77115 RepID=UPI0018E24289|nr:stonustoxin subunit beta-like [Cyprinodon tularosa]